MPRVITEFVPAPVFHRGRAPIAIRLPRVQMDCLHGFARRSWDDHAECAVRPDTRTFFPSANFQAKRLLHIYWKVRDPPAIQIADE